MREIKNFLQWLRKNCSYVQANIYSYKGEWYWIDDTPSDKEVKSVDELIKVYQNS